MRLLGVIALLLLSLAGAKAPEASCWFTSGPLTLHAAGLPTRDPFAVTFDPYPVGTTLRSVDGTYELLMPYGPPASAYFWQRGGGPSLFKPGPALNDYHVIAMCSL